MNAFSMVAVIVLASAAIPILIVWLVQRGKLARALAAANRVAVSDTRMAAIEARLAALETIATDPAQRLAHEIAQLERTAA
jgi:hypothetical protein